MRVRLSNYKCAKNGVLTKQTKLRQGKYVLSAIYETSEDDLRFTRGPFSSNDDTLEYIVTIHISDDASVLVIYGEVVW